MNEHYSRVAVVTGASAGVGKAAALVLAAQGWRIIGVGRHPQRSEAAEAQIVKAAAGRERVDFIRADFSLMADVARTAAEIAELTDHVDVLLNNAGGVQSELVITREGNETTFAANHLAPFLLSRELMPLLRAAVARERSSSARVIAVSSTAHTLCPGFDWNDLQMTRRFTPIGAYCQAKLANLLFTSELARRGAADRIIAHAMHPGIVDSNFASHGDTSMQSYMKSIDKVSPADAAKTLVWLATAPEVSKSSGRYFYQCQEIAPAASALDAACAARLWRESESLLAA